MARQNEKIQKKSRSPVQPKKPESPQEERFPPISQAGRLPGLLNSSIQRAQQQGMAVDAGRIGGNRYLGRVIAGNNRSSIQRQETGEVSDTEPALEFPAPETEMPAVCESMDVIVQEELEASLEAFSNIAVTVRWGEDTGVSTMLREEEVQFHPPYFMNVVEGSSPAVRTQERYDAAVAQRGAANQAVQNFIREFSRSERRRGWGLGRALVGKSTPDDLQRIVQGALDQNLIPNGAGLDHPDGESIRGWLQQYGIGVDCSAFVSQALNQAAERVLGRDLESSEVLNRNSAGLAGTASGFTPVADPDDLRPGDTMRIPGHIRIVTGVRPDESGGVIFTTAESRAGGTLDVGPDRADWRYEGDTLQVRRAGSDTWSNAGEAPTFGRYDFLEEALLEAETRSAGFESSVTP